MQDLSDYQKKVLLKNSNVDKITEKHVIYTYRFKIMAIEQYLKGWTANEIFEDAEIDPHYFIKDSCNSCF